jgi:hypothetical protein
MGECCGKKRVNRRKVKKKLGGAGSDGLIVYVHFTGPPKTVSLQGQRSFDSFLQIRLTDSRENWLRYPVQAVSNVNTHTQLVLLRTELPIAMAMNHFRQLEYWCCGFESHSRHKCVSESILFLYCPVCRLRATTPVI